MNLKHQWRQRTLNDLTKEEFEIYEWEDSKDPNKTEINIMVKNSNEASDLILQILKNQESIKAIREYLDIMEKEPEGYIKLSEVYHSIRRMLNDE